jgi:hypothetical protein
MSKMLASDLFVLIRFPLFMEGFRSRFILYTDTAGEPQKWGEAPENQENS